MYRLSSEVKFYGRNRVTFNYVNDVVVDTSVDKLTDTATIRLPKKLSWNDRDLYDLIRRGDKVDVSLGYNTRNHLVFTGYVSRVHMGTPIVVECENEMFRLKTVKLTDVTHTSITLKDFLNKILPNDIKTEITDMSLGKIKVEKSPTAAQVLDFLRQTYNLNIFFRDDKLFAVLPSTLLSLQNDFNVIEFNKHFNVVYGSDNMSFTREDEIKVAIEAKAILPDNTLLKVRVPEKPTEGEELKTFYAAWAKDLNGLKQFAEEKLKTFKIDTMEGSFQAFGEPLVRKGDIIKYIDPDWADRSGMSFTVAAVKYNFGLSGYRQTITLGGRIL